MRRSERKRWCAEARTRRSAVALLVLLAAAPCRAAGETVPADQPVPRTDANSKLVHQQLLEKRKQGQIDVYFEGDSITRRWGCSDPAYQDLLANWNANFHGWNAADFAWGGDTTQNILWRLQHGELDGVNPKVIVVQAGTNNLPGGPGGEAQAEDVARGIRAILEVCHEKAPDAVIILTAVFPRAGGQALNSTIRLINERIAKFADGKQIRFININDQLTDEHGRLLDGMTVDGLHLTAGGYQIWADALKPILTEVLGPPAAEDHAPPPTADPNAAR